MAGIGQAIADGPWRGDRGTVVLPKGGGRYSVTVNGQLVHVSAGQVEVTVG